MCGDVLRFNIGTDLYVRDRASPTAPERNVTLSQTQGQGDVMGVEISTDGKKALFRHARSVRSEQEHG